MAIPLLAVFSQAHIKSICAMQMPGQWETERHPVAGRLAEENKMVTLTEDSGLLILRQTRVQWVFVD